MRNKSLKIVMEAESRKNTIVQLACCAYAASYVYGIPEDKILRAMFHEAKKVLIKDRNQIEEAFNEAVTHGDGPYIDSLNRLKKNEKEN